MRISECQKFILSKTQNLNVAQFKQFWKEFKRLFASKSVKKVDPLHSNDDNNATDSNEKEDILFDSFFAGRHLIEKSPDSDVSFMITLIEFTTRSQKQTGSTTQGSSIFCMKKVTTFLDLK